MDTRRQVLQAVYKETSSGVRGWTSRQMHWAEDKEADAPGQVQGGGRARRWTRRWTGWTVDKEADVPGLTDLLRVLPEDDEGCTPP